MSNAIEIELGVKFDHHAVKARSKTVYIGKFCVNEAAHNEWEVATRDGRYLDTFAKREHAIRYANALKAR